jgi:hypothetical protein
MQTRSRARGPNWVFISLGFVCMFAGFIASFIGLSVVYYYTLYSLAITFLIAALVDLRFNTLDRKLDEVLDRLRKAGEHQ